MGDEVRLDEGEVATQAPADEDCEIRGSRRDMMVWFGVFER